MILIPPLFIPGRRRGRTPDAPPLCARCRRPIAWRPRHWWQRPRVPLLNAGHLIRAANGHLLRNSSGHLTTKCCCKVCFTKFTTSYNCSSSTWSAWANEGNFCLDPATTSTALTNISDAFHPCKYQMYVRKTPDVPCSVDGDCTSAATTPALQTNVPTCCPSACGCDH